MIIFDKLKNPYPFNTLASSTLTVPIFLNKLIIIARAIAASAAASTTTKILKICPSRISKLPKRLKAIKLTLAEFSISSIPISIAIAFFRVITANIPNVNNIDETTK